MQGCAPVESASLHGLLIPRKGGELKLSALCSILIHRKTSVQLEVDLRSDLGLTSGSCRVDRANRPEGTALRRSSISEVAIWVSELGVVEDIVALQTKLDVPDSIAGERDVLGDHDVGVIEPRSMVVIAASGAELSDGFVGEVRRIAVEPVGSQSNSGLSPRVFGYERSELIWRIRAGVIRGVSGAPERIRTAEAAVRDVVWESGCKGRNATD